MDAKQLILLQDIVSEAVRKVLKDELPRLLKEELDALKKSSSKDLKDVKILVAKQITESRKISASYPANPEERTLTEGTKNRLGEMFNKMNQHRPSPASAMIGQKIAAAVPATNSFQQVLLETARQPIEEDFEFGAGSDAEGVILNDLMPGQPVTDYGDMDDYQPRNLPQFPL